MLVDEEGNSIERLMSRWNAASQQWLGARKVLEALMDNECDMVARLVASEAVLALRNEMERAKAVYLERANSKAAQHG